MTDRLTESLFDAGDDGHTSGRYEYAEKVYARLEDRARASGDAASLLKALYFRGNMLSLQNSFDAATVALIEAVKTEAPGVDPKYRYMAMCELIEIAIWLRPIAEVRRMIAETDRHLSNLGKREWRASLLTQQARCLEVQGNVRDAKSVSWEALRNDNDDQHHQSPVYLAMWYRSHLARLCFLTLDVQGMARVEASTRNCSEESEVSRVHRTLVALYAARLRERGKRLPLALADQAEDAALVQSNYDCFVRALGLAGQWERARRVFSKLRPNATDFGTFARGVLRADLAMMEARAALRLPPIDDEITEDGPIPRRIAASLGARDLLNQASALYDAVMPIAVREDARLETHRFTRQLRSRQTSVGAILSALVD